MGYLPPGQIGDGQGNAITRRLAFDAGHRIVGHENKCAHLHGHRYVAEITAANWQLDSVGRVVDFGRLKEEVGSWIDGNWDHNMILNPEDPLLRFQADHGVFNGKLPFIMPAYRPNPTAENMAFVLLNAAQRIFSDTKFGITKVRLYETPNCWADACA